MVGGTSGRQVVSNALVRDLCPASSAFSPAKTYVHYGRGSHCVKDCGVTRAEGGPGVGERIGTGARDNRGNGRSGGVLVKAQLRCC